MGQKRAGRETFPSRLGLHDDGVDGVFGRVAIVLAEDGGVGELRVAGHHFEFESRCAKQPRDRIGDDVFVHVAAG